MVTTYGSAETATQSGGTVATGRKAPYHVSPIAITTSSLFGTGDYGAAYLCTTVTIRNDGSMRRTVNVSDWMLQDPNGAKLSPSFGGWCQARPKLVPGRVRTMPGSTAYRDNSVTANAMVATSSAVIISAAGIAVHEDMSVLT